MGSCLSKKGSSQTVATAASAAASSLPDPPCKPKPQEEVKEEQKTMVPPQAEEKVKEIFVIKHRRSHERRTEEKGAASAAAGGGGGGGEVGDKKEDSCNGINANNIAANATNNGGSTSGVAPVRTSSCTKEEVDAILIQCGRISRSSSGKASASNDNGSNSHALGTSGSRKYSGSKRSYDFDHDDASARAADDNDYDDAEDEQERRQHRHRQRHQHRSRSSHRRTPSREGDAEFKQRSGSRDRTYSSSGEEKRRIGGSGRRVSRSPGRRSETPTAGNATPTTEKSRPGRMVSVPASLSNRDKSNGDATAAAAVPEPANRIKRVSVKRSVEVGGGFRTAASPRSQSPANIRSSNENAHHHNHPPHTPSVSRNSSRKAEHSPYRRNPMNEIDGNTLNEQLLFRAHDTTNNKVEKGKAGVETGVMSKTSQFLSQKPDEKSNRVVELPQGDTDRRESSKAKEEQQKIDEEQSGAKGIPVKANEVAVTVVATGSENLKPQTITRSRSSRRSRDLDIALGFNPDSHLNPNSYASLLLEDIQNFHQQNNSTAFSLPACVTKACSILEAVADLNSCTSSNLSCAFSEDKISGADGSHSKNVSSNFHLGKRRMVAKEPFLESEVVVSDDLMEPSLHKYVTVRRGVAGEEMDEQESSGSNSFVGQHWAASSWEPNSADSTERWTSQSNYGDEVVDKEREPSSLGIENKAISEAAVHGAVVGARRLRHSGNNNNYLPTATASAKSREFDYHQMGSGLGRIGARGQTIPIVTAASM
ncbi:PREDICTED: uncharacterized protein At1g65710-like [Nelumbo nucifera]|uniref:Uncharacterized protein At1g65710-like n=2 Tax=Nelumbo nucifera TaxID=4432 RepID=A0A1U8B5Z6_NELNU|nr:PREDICTED: uncharacterized protein At1g65710-like [Nelumbo nucifera]DAD32701.1 TPA_asm: hypothetical protein HUJ06_011552 [Nelumbo nucifera]